MDNGEISIMSLPGSVGKARSRRLSIADAEDAKGARTIDCEWADGFFSRLLGLMGRDGLPEGSGLMIVPCDGIHMWFMRFPIDAVFLARGLDSETWRVTSVREGLRPWKVLPVGDRSAEAVLELPAGSASKLGLRKGKVLKCTV